MSIADLIIGTFGAAVREELPAAVREKETLSGSFDSTALLKSRGVAQDDRGIGRRGPGKTGEIGKKSN